MKKYKIPKEWIGSKFGYIGRCILNRDYYKGKFVGHSWIGNSKEELNVGMLIEQLNNFPKDTPVRILVDKQVDDENFWVSSIEYHNGSGYDLSDEVIIIGSE